MATRKKPPQEKPPQDVPIRVLFESKAREGNAGYAIAYVLLDLSGSTSFGLKYLGGGENDSKMGAIEFLGIEVKRMADAIESLAEAIKLQSI